MKRKFSKILGVGLTLALLFSLLLTAAPVSADVSSATVDVDPDEISVAGGYVINFAVSKAMVENDIITVRFPEDTDVPQATLTEPTDFTIDASPGWQAGGGWDNSDVSGIATAAADEEELTVTFTLGSTDIIGETAMVRIEFKTAADIINPTEPGEYRLEVKTSDETTYVESEPYDIDAPVVGGFVYVYNPSNILLATYGGKNALFNAEKGGHFGGKDYTITVGPGTYDLYASLDITGAGLTLESADGAEDTIIKAKGTLQFQTIRILAKDVTVDGFTVDDSKYDGIVIEDNTKGVTVENNIITDAVASGIMLDLGVAEATVSGNVIEDCGAGINLLGSALDCTISGNTITECSNEGLDIHGGPDDTDATKGNTITGNTITANECMGIRIKVAAAGSNEGGPVFIDNVIEGNTISENDESGILIDYVSGAADITGLEILNNYIADNEEDGIQIEANTWDVQVATVWVVSNVIKFNTITGNGDDGINNEDSTVDVDATFNWWGTTDADDIGDMVSSDVTYEPFLTDIAEAAIVAGKAAGNTSSLDAKSACGVKVSGVVEDTATNPLKADTICALKYAANPEEAIGDAVAFYDVYVTLQEDFATDEVEATLKFYDTAITTGSTAHFWTGDFWAKCSEQDARAGLIWVTVDEDTAPSLDELDGTPFVVVAGEVVDVFGAPELLAPEVGAADVSLTPTFAWGAVAGAIGYDFQLADNANFVLPLVNLTGDLGRLVVTAYAYVTELPYSTAYYWRVKAVSATAESAWASGVLITMAEPVEPTPPVVIEDVPAPVIEQPDIIIQPPDVIVPLPAETPITPAWIYVIIGVGGVLVIALIVLIVRTRRVA